MKNYIKKSRAIRPAFYLLLSFSCSYLFLDFVAYCYGSGEYKEGEFDRSLLSLTVEEALEFVSDEELDIKSLIEENAALKAELTARREEQQQTYVPKPLDISEYKTRKIYIGNQ